MTPALRAPGGAPSGRSRPGPRYRPTSSPSPESPSEHCQGEDHQPYSREQESDPDHDPEDRQLLCHARFATGSWGSAPPTSASTGAFVTGRRQSAARCAVEHDGPAHLRESPDPRGRRSGSRVPSARARTPEHHARHLRARVRARAWARRRAGFDRRRLRREPNLTRSDCPITLCIKRAQGVRLGRPRTLPDAVRRRISIERTKGFSFAAIAERLNAEGVPTAHGGACWYPATVRKIAASVAV